MKKFTRDDTEHGKEYYLASDVEALMAQPVQEPVAWMFTSHWKGYERFFTRYQSELTTYKADKVWPLYITPPQRTWVGLTEAEREEIENRPFSYNDWLWFYTHAVEAKIKEKNT